MLLDLVRCLFFFEVEVNVVRFFEIVRRKRRRRFTMCRARGILGLAVKLTRRPLISLKVMSVVHFSYISFHIFSLEPKYTVFWCLNFSP